MFVGDVRCATTRRAAPARCRAAASCRRADEVFEECPGASRERAQEDVAACGRGSGSGGASGRLSHHVTPARRARAAGSAPPAAAPPAARRRGRAIASAERRRDPHRRERVDSAGALVAHVVAEGLHSSSRRRESRARARSCAGSHRRCTRPRAAGTRARAPPAPIASLADCSGRLRGAAPPDFTWVAHSVRRG